MEKMIKKRFARRDILKLGGLGAAAPATAAGQTARSIVIPRVTFFGSSNKAPESSFTRGNPVSRRGMQGSGRVLFVDRRDEVN